MTTFFHKSLIALTFFCSAQLAFAAWEVQSDASSVQFVTTKAGQPGVGGISEVQKFTKFNGSMSNAGRVEFSVLLASVQTGFDIRDERLKTMLFKVVDTPQATFKADIKPAVIDGLTTGRSSDLEIEGQFTIGGQTKPMKAVLRVTRLSDSQLLLVTREPLVVNLNDYGMKAGVEALREVMGLNFVASVAPVQLYFVLKKN